MKYLVETVDGRKHLVDAKPADARFASHNSAARLGILTGEYTPQDGLPKPSIPYGVKDIKDWESAI